MDSEVQDKSGDIARWRSLWVSKEHILPKIVMRGKTTPELNTGVFYFVGDKLLFNIVAELMLDYINTESSLSFSKLEIIAMEGDWLARAKAWSAISDIEPNALFDSDLLSYTFVENKDREHFLKQIASGISHRLRQDLNSKEESEMLQNLVRGKGAKYELGQRSIEVEEKREPTELDLWFGDISETEKKPLKQTKFKSKFKRTLEKTRQTKLKFDKDSN